MMRPDDALTKKGSRKGCVIGEVCEKVLVKFRPGLLHAWAALFMVVGAGCATGIAGDPAAGDPSTDAADGGVAAPQPAGPGHPGSAAADAGSTDAEMTPGSEGSPAPATGADSGKTGASCADWAAPTVHAKCTDSCGTHSCGANGCYGMWWCQISTKTCKSKPPTGCN